MELFKTFDYALVAQGLSRAQFEEMTKSDTPDEVAYKQLKLIIKTLNGDWVPDFKNKQRVKWEAVFIEEGSGLVFNGANDWHSSSHVGSRLCFRSRELAEHCATQFPDIWKAFLQ